MSDGKKNRSGELLAFALVGTFFGLLFAAAPASLRAEVLRELSRTKRRAPAKPGEVIPFPVRPPASRYRQ